MSAVEPLQSPAAHALTKSEVSSFGASDGPGQRLHDLLVEYASTRDSYIEEFWSAAYLQPDDSPVMNLNPFFLLEDGPDQKTAGSQVGRASSLVLSSLKFASLLKSQSLSPDTVKGKPLCMDQFRFIFGSARIPVSDDIDYVANYPDSTHVAVMCNKQIYYFKGLHTSDGAVAVDEVDLSEILDAIVKDAHSISTFEASSHAVGVLTSLTRSKWAKARDGIVCHSAHNRSALAILDAALFVLVLDDIVPRDIHEAAANCLHGTYNVETTDKKVQGGGGAGEEKITDKHKQQQQQQQHDFQAGTCTNRWYDKLQLIVCKDGSAGVNFEHSAIDGHTCLRFVSDIFADTIVSFAKSITKTIYSEGHIRDHLDAPTRKGGVDFRPKRIDLELPPSAIEDIFFAETCLGDQLLANDTYVLEFKDYGKTFITNNEMSPDSFVQMSILMAYYKLYGSFVCAYEPVMMKYYLHGRTEAMRSATAAAKLFCETWSDPNTEHTEKVNALKTAIEFHSSMVRDAASGNGVDRHLYAIKCLAAKSGIPIPSLFADDGWAKLNHTIISTSNCGNPSLRLFGFGPVCPDGYGIGYIIRDGGLQYTITSKHRQTKRFAEGLASYLRDVKTHCKSRATIVVSRSAQDGGRIVVGAHAAAQDASLKDNNDDDDDKNDDDGDDKSTRSPKNKTRVAAEVMKAEGYADIYGESSGGEKSMLSRVYLRSTVDAKTFSSIGVDLAGPGAATRGSRSERLSKSFGGGDDEETEKEETKGGDDGEGKRKR